MESLAWAFCGLVFLYVCLVFHGLGYVYVPKVSYSFISHAQGKNA